MFFSFDWQVNFIIAYLEDFFSSAIASFQPRDYRVVFGRQKHETHHTGFLQNDVSHSQK